MDPVGQTSLGHDEMDGEHFCTLQGRVIPILFENNKSTFMFTALPVPVTQLPVKIVPVL